MCVCACVCVWTPFVCNYSRVSRLDFFLPITPAFEDLDFEDPEFEDSDFEDDEYLFGSATACCAGGRRVRVRGQVLSHLRRGGVADGGGAHPSLRLPRHRSARPFQVRSALDFYSKGRGAVIAIV